MNDESEVSLKTVCCTCLNADRKLEKLSRISEGVNLLYLLLSCDPDAYKEIFCKDSTSLHVCWECEAIMKKIRKFQVQASRVMRELNDFCNTRGKHTIPLSNLSTHVQTTQTIIQDTKEHFIDCGSYIKSELDPDDIPLSELKNNRNKTPETLTGPLCPQKISLKNLEPELIDECDTTEHLNSPIFDFEKAQSPIEGFKKVHSPTKSYKKAHCLTEGDKKAHRPTEGYKKAHSLTEDYIKAQSPIEDYKKTNETQPIDPKKPKKTKEISLKSYKIKIHNFSGNKKKRKKNVFNEIKLKYPCPECNSCFENKNIRWKHIQKLHREGHQCSVCEKRFALKSNLLRHEKIHSSPPPRQQCPTCNKSIRVDLMSIHSVIHTDRQKYSCISCDKTFVCRDTYHSHLKYSRAHCESDALARYKCSTCDKRYRSQAELRDHINYQHKGQTVHKCPICGKGLATKRCIRRHVRRAHEGIKENERDKICQRCGKAFRDKKSLREHEYIHTGERPLSCELCGQTFRQYASLYSHRKRVHKLVAPQKNITVLNKD